MKHYKFCWNELLTNDVEKEKEFYSKLFKWTHVDMEDAGYTYTVFQKDGEDIAGMMKWPEDHKDMHPSWFSYVSVCDVEKTVKEAKEIGAKVHLEPKEIKIGKIAVIEDTVGAFLGLFEPNCDKKDCKDSCDCKDKQ